MSMHVAMAAKVNEGSAKLGMILHIGSMRHIVAQHRQIRTWTADLSEGVLT